MVRPRCVIVVLVGTSSVTMSAPFDTSDDAADPGGDGSPSFRCSQNPADAYTAGRARTAFRVWLGEHCPVATATAQDVLISVNEALANAAEHAYVGTSGNVDLSARYDVITDTLKVIVEDYGQWRPPAPTTVRRLGSRGRGIVLMRALTDDAAIEAGEEGTRVRLTWRRLTTRATN